jgi:hypothetical protein
VNEGGTAKYAASARVDDRGDGSSRYFSPLPGKDAGGGLLGKTVKIGFFPLPVPSFPDAEIVTRSVFHVTVQRGHLNRFVVSIAARAESSSLNNSAAGVFLTSGYPLPSGDNY